MIIETDATLVVSFGTAPRVLLKEVDCDGHQPLKADPLADHHAKVFRFKFVKRLFPQAVAGGDEMRAEGGLAPRWRIQLVER